MRSYFAAALAVVLAFGVLPSEGRAETLVLETKDALHSEIRTYLLENPEIIMEMMAILEDRQRAEAAKADRDMVAANADALLDDGFSHVAGNPDGDFTIVEFLDYQCSFCRRAHPEVADLVAEDGNIRLIVKEFPILGPDSETASRAAIATLMTEGGEAYETVSDLMMRHSGPVNDAALDGILSEAGLDPAKVRAGMDDPEVTRRLVETRALAEQLSISGTPTFVFGDELARGYLPLDQMRDLVARLRAAG